VQGTKITFSHQELDAITHPEFFYVKHAAMQKMMELMTALQIDLKSASLQFPFIASFTDPSDGKIFRGENYHSMPYIILDCPRNFSTGDIFAFRTMFWWGHEFSFTLQLQGESLGKLADKLLVHFDYLRENEFYVCVNKNPWEYDFESTNYLPAAGISAADIRKHMDEWKFMKISKRLSLENYNKVVTTGVETYSGLLKICS